MINKALIVQGYGNEHNYYNYYRVIVTAVYKKTTMPELHFFNNCFHDEFSTRKLTLQGMLYSSGEGML